MYPDKDLPPTSVTLHHIPSDIPTERSTVTDFPASSVPTTALALFDLLRDLKISEKLAAPLASALGVPADQLYYLHDTVLTGIDKRIP